MNLVTDYRILHLIFRIKLSENIFEQNEKLLLP